MAKETFFKTEINNGVYSSGDIGISTNEWYDLLSDKGAQQYIDVLLCFLREPDHTSSCTIVSAKNGNTAQYYNSKVTNFSKWVQKKLDRFSVRGMDGKDTYWCIAMEKGWDSNQGFQWQMRDGLVKALQRYLMHGLIQEYKTKEPFNGKEEEYKWALLDEAEGKDVHGIIKCLRGKNIVYNAQVDGILKTLWETKPKELTTCIENLLDETRALIPRIEGFRDEMRAMCPSEWTACANDERTASAILTCRYPNEYTFYKSEVYQVICKYFGFEYRSAFLKFEHFIEIINGFVADFGEEIQQMMMPQIGKYKNKPLNLAVQTLFWCMKEEMKSAIQKSKKDSSPQETMSKIKYQEYMDLLLETRNLVLTGAPGTGKTYLAQAIADEMGAETEFVQFHPSYDYTDFVEGLRPVEKSDGQVGFERKDGVFKEFCREAIKNLVDSEKSIETLTKEISWQERLEAFVENAMENNTKFKTVNGSEFVIIELKNHSIVVHNEQNEKTTQVTVNADEILELLTNDVPLNIVRDIRNYFNRKFGTQPDSYAYVITKAVREMKQKMPAVKAYNIERKPFVFIIDEINRGEASKIFGELFYAIDPGYRGKKDHLVQTQYQNLVPETDVFAKGFYVPENVYILATMNDIDRSVESMDFAMRRRFTWKDVTPTETESMLDTLDCAQEAKATMARLNKAIEETEGLGAAYMIGPAYFLKLRENGGDFNKLWKMNIEPLLKEYLRGFRKSGEILNKFSIAYFERKDSGTDISELIDED